MADPAHGFAGGARPLVSVLMVARNTAPFIGAAIASARAQTLDDIEIVVVDDASSDGTREIAERHAAADPRVRVLDGPRAGLAAIRNTSLAEARGRFAAILDSDDLFHPGHLARLVAAADETGAEMTVANMVEFGDAGLGDGRRKVRVFAQGSEWARPRRIAVDEYVRGNTIGAEVVTGYFKPLFDLGFLRTHRLEYDRGMRIGEDFDLVFRAMLAGGQLHYLPEPGYFYRRHAASTSAMTPIGDLEAQLASADRYAIPDNFSLMLACARRRRTIVASLRTTRAIECLKRVRLARAANELGGCAQAWRGLGRAMSEAVMKRTRKLAVRRKLVPGGQLALVLGSATPAPPLATRLASLEADGWTIARAEAGPALADGLAIPNLVALSEPGAADLLPFAIAPDAPVLLASGDELAPGVMP